MPLVNVEVLLTARDQASASLRKFSAEASNLSNKFKDTGKAMTMTGGILTAAVTLPLVAAGKAAFDAAANFEQSTVAFTTMLGSADKAKSLLEDLTDFAAKTPFQLTEVESGAKQLLAMGSTMKDVIPELRMLGDVSAGLGVPMDRLILNFGQVRLQGKLTGRELRDFAVAGVPLIDELAKSMGVSKEKISDMTSAGKIGFEDVRKAFQNMTGAGGKFNNLMQKQSATTAGQISNLKDNIDKMLRSLGIQLLPIANKAISFISNLVSKFENLTDGQKRTILIVGALVAAIGPLVTILGGLMLAVAVLTSPITLVVLGIAALVAAVVGLVLIIRANFDKIKAFALNLKNNWANYLGQMIGFVATFPIKLPFYIAKAISAIIDKIRGVDWVKVWGVISTALSKIISSLPNFAKGFANTIIGFIEGVLQSGVGKWIKLPRLAEGGIVTRPTLALVGEAGPEAVIPLNRRNNTVNQNFQFNISTAFDFELAMQRAMSRARRGF